MINTDKYNITNSRIVSMILPFYARGRKIILLLDAISHPLQSIHAIWKKWALERLIEASITSQPMSIIWYLNYRFRKYFQNQTDSFLLSIDGLNTKSTIWYLEEQPLYEGTTPWLQENPSDTLDSESAKKLVTRNLNEVNNEQIGIIIYAPKIIETTLFTLEMYTNEIRKSVDKYLTVQDITYSVIINQ